GQAALRPPVEPPRTAFLAAAPWVAPALVLEPVPPAALDDLRGAVACLVADLPLVDPFPDLALLPLACALSPLDLALSFPAWLVRLSEVDVPLRAFALLVPDFALPLRVSSCSSAISDSSSDAAFLDAAFRPGFAGASASLAG